MTEVEATIGEDGCDLEVMIGDAAERILGRVGPGFVATDTCRKKFTSIPAQLRVKLTKNSC